MASRGLQPYSGSQPSRGRQQQPHGSGSHADETLRVEDDVLREILLRVGRVGRLVCQRWRRLLDAEVKVLRVAPTSAAYVPTVKQLGRMVRCVRPCVCVCDRETPGGRWRRALLCWAVVDDGAACKQGCSGCQRVAVRNGRAWLCAWRCVQAWGLEGLVQGA